MKPPRILLSLDSTWWNRLGLSRFTFGRMLSRIGCETRSIRFRDVINAQHFESTDFDRLLDDVDGLLLSGGGDVGSNLYGSDGRFHRGVKPLRDRFEMTLLDQAAERGLPVLGVCRGAQLLNVHRGGTNISLRRDPHLYELHRLRRRHSVDLVEGSRLWEMVSGAEGRLGVTSYHAHAVKQCGKSLRIAARSTDGVVEAIESTDDSTWQLGVQWHPEWMSRDRYQLEILRRFRDAAAT